MRAQPLALVAVLIMAAPILAGCIVGEDDNWNPTLEVYEYRYPGDDVFVAGHPYGFAARIHNPTDRFVEVTVDGYGTVDTWGPVLAERGWVTSEPEYEWPLEPGGSLLFLFQTTADAPENGTLGFWASATASEPGRIATTGDAYLRAVTVSADAVSVEPGDHVQTATLGLWANGTSFYTNIADLNADESFPASYDRSTFDGAPLPVYVYDENNDEQPNRSIDTCHFTTITGYNALLKTQAEASTDVRFLRPDEAYTLPGRENHDLYGDALIFVNTIVAHDGATDQMDALPDPTGECFDPQNYQDRYVPLEVPPATL